MHNSRSSELSPKELESISLDIINEIKKLSLDSHCELYTAIKLILREYGHYRKVSELTLLNYLNISEEYAGFKLPSLFDYNSTG